MSDAAKQPDSRSGNVAAPRSKTEGGVRWHRLLQQSSDALFVLNHQRQLLFANKSWEELTGISFVEVRGHTCKPASKTTSDQVANLLAALAPPVEVRHGDTVTIRRVIAGAKPRTWDICYLPFHQEDRLRGIVGKIIPLTATREITRAPLPSKLLALRDRFKQWHRIDQIEGSTAEMRRAREQMHLAAMSHDPVWISGEPGTGKEWTARAIHQISPVSDRCFVALDCRCVPKDMIGNILFGAGGLLPFSGAGTIYFKEPQFLPLEIQAKLVEWRQLHHWQSAAEDQSARLMIGSSANLESTIAANELSNDFCCAFTTITVSIPPLRQRSEEFTLLTKKLLKQASVSMGKEITDVAPDGWECLRAATWPGNLRELYQVLMQSCRRAKGETIAAGDLPWYLREAPVPQPRSLPMDKLMEDTERRLIRLALNSANHNKSKAAEILQISRARLIRRLKDLEIDGSD